MRLLALRACLMPTRPAGPAPKLLPRGASPGGLARCPKTQLVPLQLLTLEPTTIK